MSYYDLNLVTFTAIQLKRDALPKIGGCLQYSGEKYEVILVKNNEQFWQCRKTWTRSRAKYVRNPYRWIEVAAKEGKPSV